MSTIIRNLFVVAAITAVGLTTPAGAEETPVELTRPDDKPADMSKPVQVYILLGQSNMVGMGHIAGDKAGSLEHAVKAEKKYPYLVDDAGNWTVRQDVRNVFTMGSGVGSPRLLMNNWLTIQGCKRIGPEVGIGWYLGQATDAPVLVLKSCIGNRSLGWDLLPPGSEPYEYEGKMIPGYRGTPDDPKGNGQPVAGAWYAGCQYDGDVANAKAVLADLGKYYPEAKSYEVAGFFFWQGDKDRYSAANANRYEKNLVQFIKALRKDFNAPKALFVVATLGQTKMNAGGNEGLILNAQLAVGDPQKHPEFKGTVASVYTNPFCHGGASNSHYGGNAETYMDIGEAMGRAMVTLLGARNKQVQVDPKDAAALADAEKLIAGKQYLQAVAALQRLAAAKPDTVIAKKAAERLNVLQQDPATGQAIIDAEADAFETRCVAAEESKDYALAIKRYEQYVAQFPKASRLAEVKAHLKSLKSDKAVQTDIKSAGADTECKSWMSMADNFAKAGMNSKARDYLQKIIDKYPDTDWATQARTKLAKIPGR